LDLTLLVDAERDGMIQRIQVRSNDIAYLLDKEGITGELKMVLTMWLESERMPDTTDRLSRHMRGAGH
jgi:hypothetical protein